MCSVEGMGMVKGGKGVCVEGGGEGFTPQPSFEQFLTARSGRKHLNCLITELEVVTAAVSCGWGDGGE